MFVFYALLFLCIVLESFPISSSGHMVLFERIVEKFGYAFDYVHASFAACDVVMGDLLEHFVHGATVVVLAVFFFPRWFFLLKNFRRCGRIIFKIISLAFVADCITALLYLLFHFYGNPALPLGMGFAITATLLLALRCVPASKQSAAFDIRKALILGFVQGVALLPGISRFASTFVCARLLALPAHKAFEVSFLIQWPLICAAFLNSMRVMVVCPQARVLLAWDVLAVMALASLVAYAAFCWVARMAYAEKLWKFGVYMLVPIMVWLLL